MGAYATSGDGGEWKISLEELSFIAENFHSGLIGRAHSPAKVRLTRQLSIPRLPIAWCFILKSELIGCLVSQRLEIPTLSHTADSQLCETYRPEATERTSRGGCGRIHPSVAYASPATEESRAMWKWPTALQNDWMTDCGRGLGSLRNVNEETCITF